MSAAGGKLSVLLDAGVPDAVGRAFTAAGHWVIHHREVLSDGSPDTLVCRAAMENDAVLVAIDDDMKRLMRTYGARLREDRFAHLHLIAICGNEVQAAARIGQALDLIEREWSHCTKKAARRLWIEVGSNYIRTNR